MPETTRIVLAARPDGEPTAEHFRTESAVLPDLQPGDVLLETLYLSIDPYQRARMNAVKTYAPRVEIGERMVGGTVSRVLESTEDAFRPGDVVVSSAGWQTHSVERADTLHKLDPDAAPISTALGVLGMPGFTAYAGMHNIGKPKPGETVVVAAATGPVGSVVGQLAKIAGARAVGIAGGPHKVKLLEELGFDAAIDHRADDFADQLAAATPDGIDVYFENVGGRVFEAVLPRLNFYGRVPLCGLVTGLNGAVLPEEAYRLSELMRAALSKSLTIRGFIMSEFFAEQMPQFRAQMAQWLREGKVQYREDITDGLQSAPQVLAGVLRGDNFGKAIIRV